MTIRSFYVLTIALFCCSSLKAQPFDSFISFDGVDDELSIWTSDVIQSGSNFTIEFWFRTCLPTFYNQQGIIGKSDELEFNLFHGFPSGPLYHQLCSKNQWNTWVCNQDHQYAPDSEWHHMAITYDYWQEEYEYYFDGIDGTINAGSNDEYEFNAIFNLYVGRADYNTWNKDHFKGFLDELRISDTIRYDGDFTRPSTAFTNDAWTTGLWHFDQDSIANFVFDDSGNQADFAATGNPEIIHLDTLVSQVDGSLIVPDVFDSYQWRNCLNDSLPILGETHYYYNLSPTPGSYAVEVTLNSCPMLSNCFDFNDITGTDILIGCDSLQWIDGNTYYSSNDTTAFNIVGGAANSDDSLVFLDLTILNNAFGVDMLEECDSLLWIDGNTYYSSNNSATFSINGGAANGCDSLVTLDLTINSPDYTTEVVAACDSFKWIDGVTYTSSTNTPTMTFTNASGCDSVIILNLTINNSSNGNTIYATACEEYLSPSGNYIWNSTGLYYDTILTASECDSVLLVDLTIQDIDTAVSIVGNTLTSMQSGASYQWINCLDGSPIIGATDQTFEITNDGEYAVIISTNNCTDTSNCINTALGLEKYSYDVLKLYPNPTSEGFTIEFHTDYPKVSLKILNSIGQVLSEEIFENTDRIDGILEGDSGLYFIEIELDNSLIRRPIVKQN